MSETVAVIGIVIIGFGILGIASPATLIRLTSAVVQSKVGIYAAAALRLAFGIVLIAAASASHFPQTLLVLGVITIVAAILVPFIGIKRLRALVDWWIARPPGLIRAWAAIAVALGIFLVTAVS